MMLRGLPILAAVGLVATAQADGHPTQYLETNPLAGCSLYMTETECRVHQRILNFLSEPRERSAYLAMHAQLIEERRALCGVPEGRKPRYLVMLTSGLH